MSDAQERLDEILTATASYREELAAEIMQRVDLLNEQITMMSDAATHLLGRPAERRAPPHEVDRWQTEATNLRAELEAAYKQINNLDEEVGTLKKSLQDSSEPLSTRLTEMEEEVQEARDLAVKRDKELESALAEVTRLEHRIREASSAPPPEGGRLLGSAKLRDNGPEGNQRPIFGLPRSNLDVYQEAVKLLGQKFAVYLLEDGSLLYKSEPAEEVTRPESPQPGAETRQPVGTKAAKEERQEQLLRHLQEHHASGTFNGPDIAEDLGLDAKAKARLGQDLRDMEEQKLIRRTGMEFPRGVTRHRETGKMGGRPAIQYRLGQEARPEVKESEVQKKVRDAVVNNPALVSPRELATELELKPGDVLAALENLASRGVVEDKSPSADMRLFQYVRPKGPGKAAELDARRGGNHEADTASRFSGGGVATGRTRAGNKDVQDLINAAERAGAKVTHEASGHFAVTIPGSGKRILISSTPSNPRTVLNDRSRLRRAGLSIA